MKYLDSYDEVSNIFERLYPLCRSILGDGYRQSMNILKEYIPLEEDKFFSGEKVLNWIVPKEWVIKEAYIKDSAGNMIINFKDNNLYVVNYSSSVDKIVDLQELKQHIYTSEKDDNAVPYTISYYKKRWGFCMSKNQLNKLKEDKYHVFIDSDFIDGYLVTGQTVLPALGEKENECKKEILLTSYLCHPSMANNELSGPIVLAMLYQKIKRWKKRKYAYRFLINPETIGSISYLSRYGEELKKSLYAGLVLTCLGGDENLRYKMSRMENSPFDLLIKHINNMYSGKFRTEIFDPASGSDERQYCSAGFNLPVGQISRMVYGEYKEYHTSLDTKEVMGIDNIIDSCNQIEGFLLKNEANGYYKNLYPYGEIKLGDYDLYPTLNSDGKKTNEQKALINEPWFVSSVMMILNYSDGCHPLSYCAERLKVDLIKIKYVADVLVEKGLLEECSFL